MHRMDGADMRSQAKGHRDSGIFEGDLAPGHNPWELAGEASSTRQLWVAICVREPVVCMCVDGRAYFPLDCIK